MRVIYLSNFKFKSLKREITCFLSFLFAVLAIRKITDHERRVNYHCLLFGKISERDRVFEEGSIPLCYVFVVTQYMMAFFSLFFWYLTRKYPEFSWADTLRSRMCWVGWFVYLVSLIITIIIGLRSVCNSLTAPSCQDSIILYIDFKVFKPKYFDAWYFVRFWTRTLQYTGLSMLSSMFFCCFNWSKQDERAPTPETYVVVPV